MVIPLTTSAWLMQRNLLYTAVTRAKRIVVLVGNRCALAKAVRTQGAGRRYTALSERLRPGRAGRSQQRSQADLQPASCNRLRSSLSSGQCGRVGPAGRSG